ncbi:MAG: hypothetical protein KDE58_20205 [Caldilineaceae bacterium]|nr:hypothetical protein [Caldilineaceae bacterium]
MYVPLLSTKLHIPRRQSLLHQSTLVPRPRLLKRLNAGVVRKLTLIAAPAGSGKSTLLSEWIGDPAASKDARRPAFCWLSIEESDNDPTRFWLYCIAAIHAEIPGLSPSTPTLLQSPEPPPLETILTILLNDLEAWSLATRPETVPALILVLEDYHVITTPVIHESLTFLLDHLPPTLHLVISTRADPPLPLARLRASGQLTEIRVDDLRFTAAETALFCNERMALDLSADEVQLLPPGQKVGSWGSNWRHSPCKDMLIRPIFCVPFPVVTATFSAT